jgi:hypothetical protein
MVTDGKSNGDKFLIPYKLFISSGALGLYKPLFFDQV